MQETERMIEEVQQLVWALVDEAATDGQVRRLESLVLAHPAARRAYVDCVTLHAELHCLFAPPQPAGLAAAADVAKPKAVILNLDLPPANGASQTA